MHMRRRLLLIVCLVTMTAVGCGNTILDDVGKSGGQTESGPYGKTAAEAPGLDDAGLTKMLKDFDYLPDTIGIYEPVTDGKGFPLELVNLLGEALYKGNAGSVIRGLQDSRMQLSYIELFHLREKNPDGAFHDTRGEYYRSNNNGDVEDVIYFIADGIFPLDVIVYEKSGEHYVRKDRPIGDVSSYAFFTYQGVDYMAAECNTGPLGDSDVRLYRLGADFGTELMQNQLCIVKQKEITNVQIRYQNLAFQLYGLQTYVDGIREDLIYVGSGYGTFYGDETKREDLCTAWTGKGLDLSNVYAADGNNDGIEEYFDRKADWNFSSGTGSGGEMLLCWINKDQISFIPSPVTLWENDSYVRRQTWFKEFCGKTVIFSLYLKNGAQNQNQYLIDARICENGKTAILLEETLYYRTTGVSLVRAVPDENWGGSVYVSTEEYYHDPDKDSAFPADMDERTASLRMKTPDTFSFGEKRDAVIPPAAAAYLKDLLHRDGSLGDEVLSYKERQDQASFLDEYGEQAQGYGIAGNQNDMQYVYRYQLGRDTYFLAPVGISGITSIGYNVFKKTEDRLTYCGKYSADSPVPVIKWDNSLYLLDYQHDSYLTKRYLWGISINELAPQGKESCAVIRPARVHYRWEVVYNHQGAYGNAVEEYLGSIKNSLMKQAETGLYHGDETQDIDREKLERLRSVEGDVGQKFYEIDFNNDGILDYVSKKRINGDLEFDIHCFEEKQTVSINYGLEDGPDKLSQFWFKKLDGKVFTFKMISKDSCWFLNVSLAEGADITQVESYLIMPEREFVFD